MAIKVDNLAEAIEFEIAVQVYMLGEFDKKETRAMLKKFVELEVNIGDYLLLRYPVVDPNHSTLDVRWRLYPVHCPKCGKPTVYFFSDFGPGCSGMNGGCGYKVLKEKRPWYEFPNDANRGSVPQKK